MSDKIKNAPLKVIIGFLIGAYMSSIGKPLWMTIIACVLVAVLMMILGW
jgi:hypothetical protein